MTKDDKLSLAWMEPLHHNAVVPALFRSLPEAKVAYADWDMPGEPLPYIVFSFLDESFFGPSIRSSKDTELLTRVFRFLEQMAVSPDSEVVNLLWIGLFESWVGDQTILRKAFRYMGPATQALAVDAAHALSCGDNLPR